MRILKQVGAVVLSLALAVPAFAQGTDQLQQLVAPIALYPDALVAQVLAASTYPSQVVEADRWVRSNSGLKGEQLVAAVDQQPWDPSVKGLTQFPSVLDNMSKNLSWTSSLGDAYFNDPNGVMSAIQMLRVDAEKAGNLKSTPEQTVTTQGQTIVIEPANPQVVYVPEYSPSVVYGAAIPAYPGYSGWDVAAASALSFGVGAAVGAATGAWGWGHWGTNWNSGNVTFNRNTYVSNSNTFANRSAYGQSYRGPAGGQAYRGPAGGQAYKGPAGAEAYKGPQGGAAYRGPGGAEGYRPPSSSGNLAKPSNTGASARNYSGASSQMSRGFGEAGQSSLGTRSNAFSGFSQGGAARMDSARGSSSFSGARSSGGGARMGGGGGFGGGGRGGGGRR